MQQTSTSKLQVCSLIFKKRGYNLRVNETKLATENAYNRDHFGF